MRGCVGVEGLFLFNTGKGVLERNRRGASNGRLLCLFSGSRECLVGRDGERNRVKQMSRVF